MSLQAKTFDSKGKAAGETKLSEAVFGVTSGEGVMYDSVLSYLAAARQGTAKTKTRAEVRGGGKKPYKQKGTGSARQGSIRSPIMVGGGKAFGPNVRNYEYRIPAKSRSLALRAALSQAQREGKVFVVKEFKIAKPKTKEIAGLFEELKLVKGLVVDTDNATLEKSVRNLSRAKYVDVSALNVFDVLKFENVLFSATAVSKVQERLGA
jgi:large subunit ribosomal protein L4